MVSELRDHIENIVMRKNLINAKNVWSTTAGIVDFRKEDKIMTTNSF